MATATDFINAALRLIQVKGAETPISTQEETDGIETLNDLGAQLEAEGFELGFTTISVGGDTVTIPEYANAFYKNQLAARLAPEYLIDGVPPFLTEAITASRRVVVRNLNRKAVGVAGTFQNLIYGAIELLGVKDGREPVSLSEIQNAVPRLNDLVLDLESKGFRLGYNINTTTDITKETGLPDWSNAWIKAELAIRLSVSYSIAPNDVIIKMSESGLDDAYQRTVIVPTVNFPSTLPIGETRCYTGVDFFGDPLNNTLENGSGNPILTDEGIPIKKGVGENE